MKRRFELVLAFLLAGSVYGAEKDFVPMFRAYADFNMTQARKLAKDHIATPEGRLIHALCLINDKESPNIPGGLAALEKVVNEHQLPAPLQIQAELSYARTAQLIRFRSNLYGHLAENVDYNAIYDRIMTQAPNSDEACFAALYKYQEVIDGKNPAKVDEGMEKLEQFARDFNGNRKMLTGIYQFLGNAYIWIKNDNRRAAEALGKAYALGIANPTTEQHILFTLARIYDAKLHDRPMAEKYYHEFIRRFPYSNMKALAETYLSELKK